MFQIGERGHRFQNLLDDYPIFQLFLNNGIN